MNSFELNHLSLRLFVVQQEIDFLLNNGHSGLNDIRCCYCAGAVANKSICTRLDELTEEKIMLSIKKKDFLSNLSNTTTS